MGDIDCETHPESVNRPSRSQQQCPIDPTTPNQSPTAFSTSRSDLQCREDSVLSDQPMTVRFAHRHETDATRSDVEAELHHVTVDGLILLALDPEDAGVTRLRP